MGKSKFSALSTMIPAAMQDRKAIARAMFFMSRKVKASCGFVKEKWRPLFL